MKELALTINGYSQLTLPGQIDPNRFSLQGIISFVVMSLLVVAILLSFFFLIFGGLKWILSQGDKKQVEEAQKTITFAIIGLVVALLSFFIINLVGFAFRVPLIRN